VSRKLSIALFVHSLRSDWNNGNAHFLRGLARALGQMGHRVTTYERERDWSVDNLLLSENGRGHAALHGFSSAFPDLHIVLYGDDTSFLRAALLQADIAIVHEWHTPHFISALLDAAQGLPVRLLFLDTHHRASSSPEQIARLQVRRFHGVLAFGDALRQIYSDKFGIARAWTFHEAADTSVFSPSPGPKADDVVWIGNWGDDERTRELRQFLIRPAERLGGYRFAVHGVRYPPEAVAALHGAGIAYLGYLPNLDAPAVYRAARLTLHIPRQQYACAVAGTPTIRVFEALAAGIPLISAPWQDCEHLFRPGDFRMVQNEAEMSAAISELLRDETAARQQADQGRETILARHTCRHRAEQLTAICEELLA
jgi:spore maturation protein CgeB